jgi:hypothetical protein
MALRITVREDPAGSIVRVDGRLEGDGVVELARVLAGLPDPHRLDLADLRSADEVGLEALRSLQARGVSMARLSRYLSLLLEAGSPRAGGVGRVSGRRARSRRRPETGPA